MEEKQFDILPLAGFSFSEYHSPSISHPTLLGSPCFELVGCAHDITFFGFVILVSTKLSIKKAERRRTDAFELWCWRRLLRVSWAARRSNQSILKEISPGCSLEGLMLKLKLQYLGHLMRRANSLEKNPDAGKNKRQEDKGMRGRHGSLASPTQWTWVW